MSAPIEMIRGGERQTVYSDMKALGLMMDGWKRVSDLPQEEQQRLVDLPPIPWAGYDEMRVEEVIARAHGLEPQRIQEIVAYESATKGRISIVNKLLGRKPTAETQATEEQPPVVVETVKERPMKTVEKIEVKPAVTVSEKE